MGTVCVFLKEALLTCVVGNLRCGALFNLKSPVEISLKPHSSHYRQSCEVESSRNPVLGLCRESFECKALGGAEKTTLGRFNQCPSNMGCCITT